MNLSFDASAFPNGVSPYLGYGLACLLALPYIAMYALRRRFRARSKAQARILNASFQLYFEEYVKVRAEQEQVDANTRATLNIADQAAS